MPFFSLATSCNHRPHSTWESFVLSAFLSKTLSSLASLSCCRFSISCSCLSPSSCYSCKSFICFFYNPDGTCNSLHCLLCNGAVHFAGMFSDDWHPRIAGDQIGAAASDHYLYPFCFSRIGLIPEPLALNPSIVSAIHCYECKVSAHACWCHVNFMAGKDLPTQKIWDLNKAGGCLRFHALQPIPQHRGLPRTMFTDGDTTSLYINGSKSRASDASDEWCGWEVTIAAPDNRYRVEGFGLVLLQSDDTHGLTTNDIVELTAMHHCILWRAQGFSSLICIGHDHTRNVSLRDGRADGPAARGATGHSRGLPVASLPQFLLGIFHVISGTNTCSVNVLLHLWEIRIRLAEFLSVFDLGKQIIVAKKTG